MPSIYQKVRAIFQPVRTDDLIPSALPLIGKEGVFMASYILDEGPYVGQFAMGIEDRTGEWSRFMAAWVPESDLKILEVLEC